MTKALNALNAQLEYVSGTKNAEILQTLTNDELTAVCLADDIVRCYGEGLDAMIENSEGPWIAAVDVVETTEDFDAFATKSEGVVNGYKYKQMAVDSYVSVVDLGDRRIVVKSL